MRSRREKPAARSAGRARSRAGSRRGEHLRPPPRPTHTPAHPRPPTSPRSAAPGAARRLPAAPGQERAVRRGQGRGAARLAAGGGRPPPPGLSRPGAAARQTAAVRRGRPPGAAGREKERSRPLAKRRDGVCRRGFQRGSRGSRSAAGSAGLGGAVPAGRTAGVPRSRSRRAFRARCPALPAAAHQPPRCLPPPPRSLPAPRAAGQRGSRGLPSGTGRRQAALRLAGGGGLGGCPHSSACQAPQSLPKPFCSALRCRPTRGERRPPPEQGLSSPPSARGGLGGPSRFFSTPRQTGSEKPLRPRGEGGRDRPGVPSGEEGEGSRGRRAESEVQAWGSGTRARGEAGNPRPSGQSQPFPSAAGAGEPALSAAALGSHRIRARGWVPVRGGEGGEPRTPSALGLGSLRCSLVAVISRAHGIRG